MGGGFFLYFLECSPLYFGEDEAIPPFWRTSYLFNWGGEKPIKPDEVLTLNLLGSPESCHIFMRLERVPETNGFGKSWDQWGWEMIYLYFV